MLGITDSVVEGAWRTEDGFIPGWTNWDSKQPDNYKNTEDYVIRLNSNNKWNDIAEDAKYPFYCEGSQILMLLLRIFFITYY